MLDIVPDTGNAGMFLLLVLSYSPEQSCYNQLIPNTCVQSETRVIEILSHFHMFRQWVVGSILSSFRAVFFCLFNLFTILPKHEQQKIEQLEEPKLEIHRVLKDSV